VLPLVYDDSLSYYELLCKVVHYINDLINSDKEILDNVDALKTELETVQNWINNYDTSFAEKRHEVKSETWANLGKGADAAVEYLIQKYESFEVK
jgi:peptidoglycan hydrolase CwlO-like protein